MTMDSIQELEELYLSHGLASRVIPSSQKAVITKLVEVLKAQQLLFTNAFVQTNAHLPLLYSYSFDATSAVVRKGQLKGQLLQELLMQRLVVRIPIDLALHNMLMVFAEAVPMI